MAGKNLIKVRSVISVMVSLKNLPNKGKISNNFNNDNNIINNNNNNNITIIKIIMMMKVITVIQANMIIIKFLVIMITHSNFFKNSFLRL